MNQKDDLRVRRTQKMLTQAFVELIIEEGFDGITVQKLAERAMINRATFYRHYEDKFDLARKIYADMTAEHMKSVQEQLPVDLISAWSLLFEHMAKHGDFYSAMLRTMPNFWEEVREHIERDTYALLNQMGLDESKILMPLPIILRYLTIAQMGIVQWWLEAGQPIPPKEMAQHLMTLHMQGGLKSLQLQIDFNEALSTRPLSPQAL